MFVAPNIGLLIARRGAGKTTLLKQAIALQEKFIIYDVNEEYSYQEFNAVEVYHSEDLKKLLIQGEPRIIFRPMRTTAESINYFFAIIWLYGRNLMLFISEFGDVCAQPGEYFERLVRRGRHKNIGMLGDCHRPFGIPRLYMSQLDVLFVGLIKQIPEDVRYLKQWLSEEAFNEAMKVKRFYFLRVVDEPERFQCAPWKIVENKIAFTA